MQELGATVQGLINEGQKKESLAVEKQQEGLAEGNVNDGGNGAEKRVQEAVVDQLVQGSSKQEHDSFDQQLEAIIEANPQYSKLQNERSDSNLK